MSENITFEKKKHITVLFAGDSGDGMQLTGTQFTNTNALYGNDVSTFPNFPAEIRAPQGTLSGVSGFQLQFGSNEIYTARENKQGNTRSFYEGAHCFPRKKIKKNQARRSGFPGHMPVEKCVHQLSPWSVP